MPRLKNRLKQFSEHTSIEGFQELFHSKAPFWKLVWAVLIISGVGLCAYQIIQLGLESIERPTTSVIEPLSSPAQYPSMTFSYMHWMYWVDWNKSVVLGFDKSSLLYGLGFLSETITEKSYNLTEAEIKFKNVMNKNGMSRLIEFFSAISYDSPPGIAFQNIAFSKLVKHITPAHGIFSYEATNEMISRVFQNTTNDQQIIFNYDQNHAHYDSNFLSQRERDETIKIYVKSLTGEEQDANFTVNNFTTAPPTMTFNNVRDDKIAPSGMIFQSRITITSSLYHWYNTSKHQCNSNPAITMHHSHCKEFCFSTILHEQFPTACISIAGAVLLEIDQPEKVCRHKEKVLSSTLSHQEDVTIPNSNSEQIYRSGSYKTCVEKYCRTSCDEWKHSIFPVNLNVPAELSHMKVKQTFYISYPGTAILEMWQFPSQTWSSILGNVGGILGLWLGASIMSMFQMAYLLCCFHE